MINALGEQECFKRYIVGGIRYLRVFPKDLQSCKFYRSS